MADDGDGEGGDQREQDHLLPIANIGRMMKQGVPQSAKISKDAKECMQECVTEFISFITMEANEKCLAEKRKTINGDDLIWAMKNLGFDEFVEPLSIYLNRYKEVMGTEMSGDPRLESIRRREDGDVYGDDFGMPGGMQPSVGYTLGMQAGQACMPTMAYAVQMPGQMHQHPQMGLPLLNPVLNPLFAPCGEMPIYPTRPAEPLVAGGTNGGMHAAPPDAGSDPHTS